MPKTTIAGGAVHQMPKDLRTALASSSAALTTWERHYTASSQRVDLLDYFRQESGDERPPHRMGLRVADRRKTPTLLLAQVVLIAKEDAASSQSNAQLKPHLVIDLTG
jgi:hypothetical protein